MRVTHPYVEVPDHSGASMCAKDTSLNSPCVWGGRGLDHPLSRALFVV